jgi:exodeoxyribonuclease-1
MSLVFYDTETTGTDTFFDQILQFAAIQTDEELKEIDRIEIRSRLLPHIVPAPGAMRVTGVTVSQLTDTSIPSHYEMVRAIREKLLSWSPALFIGWNTIDFDESLIRQAFYKTLHNPYLTNRDGNTRSDVMRIVQACSIFAPTAIKIPTGEKGQKVFKLDRVAPANGFKHDQAHNAMGDVLATIFVCRLLMEKAPDIWSSFMRFSTKAAVTDFITDELLFCWSDFFFGKPFSCIVTAIGQNKAIGTEWYIYDLSVDPNSLLTLSDEQLAARLARTPKPLRRLRSNAAPMLFPAEDAPEICKGRENGLNELERRANVVKADARLRERLIAAFETLKEEYPSSPHVEKQIYDGFIEEADEKLMVQFHEAEWPKRLAIVEKFKDLRLKKIGWQLVAFERPELLDQSMRRAHHLAAANRLLGQGEDVTWLTLPKALEEIKLLLSGASGAKLQFLREHEQYLRLCHKEALSHGIISG